MTQSDEKSPQVARTTSEGVKKIEGIQIELPRSTSDSIYGSIDIAREVIDFSISKDWSKEQLLQAIKIIQSLEHFS